MSETNNPITYEIKDKLFIITLNNPKALNSLTIPQFTQLADLIVQANNHPTTIITLIQSTGKLFSAGANIKTITTMQSKTSDYYLSNITSKNMYLVHLFTSHRKILAIGLNGPVVGLTASLVVLCDLIYAMNDKIYMSFPFSNIGLTNECAISASLPKRIGYSKALEHIMFAKAIPCNDLYRLGLINKVFDFTKGQDGEFNKTLQNLLAGELDGLDGDTVLSNRALIKESFNNDIKSQVLDESMKGLADWVANKPQNAFAEIIKGTRKHKL
ncbi:hypothetical protein CANARDRAFT_201090 [[Candida] arabinofermentans NRRL YB-2248]|uniref:Uncharacterized protein n=1 Tax=[Candida] arabinofermentans NRRL YB-2248 TaxID=983967 RepID=A0A1E4SXR1_9ASCO|nr:hypothetical protein CANARDRAFT_201090 [[Candida] arabinofermentans NRRL YB-2248]